MLKKSRKLLVLTSFIAGLWTIYSSNLVSAPKGNYELPAANTQIAINADTTVLKQISKALGSIAEGSKKSLVYISISKTLKGPQMGQVDPFDFFGLGDRFPGLTPPPKQEGLGSGFIIDVSQGYILTNNHVVEDADNINLKLSNGASYEGKLVGRDKFTDVAVIKIDDKNFDRNGLGALVLDDSDKASVGEFVIALGAPFGLEASISFGVISAIGRGSLHITRLGNFIQTDAAINPGNSGGPLVNMDGKVLGINTAIFSKSGAYNGIGFTVPANIVRHVATSLINDGKTQNGYVGIYFPPEPLKEDAIALLKLPKGTSGYYVTQVAKGGPAQKAGIEEGDVIVAINDKKVGSQEGDLANIIGFMKPGDKAAITFYREGQIKTVSFAIGAFPGEGAEIASDDKEDQSGSKSSRKAKNPYGLLTSPITPELRSRYGLERHQGLVITGVMQGSPASKAGFGEGDVIVAVNGRKLTKVAELEKILNSSETVLLHFDRKGSLYFVPLKKVE